MRAQLYHFYLLLQQDNSYSSSNLRFLFCWDALFSIWRLQGNAALVTQWSFSYACLLVNVHTKFLIKGVRTEWHPCFCCSIKSDIENHGISLELVSTAYKSGTVASVAGTVLFSLSQRNRSGYCLVVCRQWKRQEGRQATGWRSTSLLCLQGPQGSSQLFPLRTNSCNAAANLTVRSHGPLYHKHLWQAWLKHLQQNNTL